MPTHTAHYALNFGKGKPKEIAEGYGAGTVKIKHNDPVTVSEASDTKVKFERDGQKYVLWRTGGDKWMMRKSAAYTEGYNAMLTKLGFNTASTALGTSEQGKPLHVGDDDLPAGLLAKALTELPSPPRRDELQKKKRRSYFDLMRTSDADVSWSSPESIPASMATGPSPVYMRG